MLSSFKSLQHQNIAYKILVAALPHEENSNYLIITHETSCLLNHKGMFSKFVFINCVTSYVSTLNFTEF